LIWTTFSSRLSFEASMRAMGVLVSSFATG
jgi:hypothetical protein